MVLLLSLVPVTFQPITILNPPAELAILYVFAAFALVFAFSAPVVLLIGALMAEEYKFKNNRDVFYKGDVPSGEYYREATQRANELLDIYDEAESKSLTAITLWGITVLFMGLVISFGALAGRGLQWANKNEWIPEMPTVIAGIGAVFIVLLPILIFTVYGSYLWIKVVRGSEPWRFLVKKAQDEFEDLLGMCRD